MRKQQPAGLVVEGNATGSPLLSLRGIAEEIGPVKSTSLRVARRLSNLLRAGRGVNAYEDLQESALVLVRVPDASLERVIKELCAAELPFPEMSIVACETWLPYTLMEQLEKRGASVATITAVSGSAENWFVAEGGVRAIRLAKRMVEGAGGKLVQIRPGGKSFYFAAELLATVIPMPIMAAAQKSLREAGISGRLLSILMEQFCTKMTRSFNAGTRSSKNMSFGSCPEKAGREHLARLESHAPEFAALINAHLAQYLGRPIGQSGVSAKLK